MPERNVALIVPSIRKDSFERFVREWSPTGLLEKVDLILMEDNPARTFETGLEVDSHLCWYDVDSHRWSWIIPRRSDTVRSYAYWWAWQIGYEFMMTLDDDCYPADGYQDLIEQHLSMLCDRTRWYNTLNSVIPRGMPYYDRGEPGSLPVMVNHGIWQGVLDYDAPHQLADPRPEVYDHSNRIVPRGAYFPMCGMNVAWRRDATVLMYHLLMGQALQKGSETWLPGQMGYKLEKLPFDRFGDIWCGVIMKKVADHLGWSVSTGTPHIHHDRASNPFTNLRKEANGIEVNEWFWRKIDGVSLAGLGSATDCYHRLGSAIQDWDGEHERYWKLLGEAMMTWSELFES